MHTVHNIPPVRFTRGSLADRAQQRRDARHLAEVLRLEGLLADLHVSAKR